MAAVEEFEVADAAGSADQRRPRGRSGRTTARAATWVGVAGALVAVGAMTASPVPLGTGLSGGLDLGLLDLPLHDEPQVLWQSTLEDAAVMHTAGDRAVLASDDDGRTRSVLGVDLRTGGEAWRFVDSDYSCQAGVSVVCVTDPGSDDARIVMIAIDDGRQEWRDHPGAMIAVDAGLGLAVVEDTAAYDEDVVLIGDDGTEHWRTRTEVINTSVGTGWGTLRVADGRLWIDYSSTTIDLGTGAREEYATTRWVMEDGTLVEIDDAAKTAMIRTHEGSVPVDLDEVLPWMDDDIGGAVKLVQRFDNLGVGDLVATMRTTGEVLWTHTATECNPQARLRGVVVVSCWVEAPGISGIDLLTGRTRWQLPGGDWLAAASADTIVLASEWGGGLRAVDVATGSELWTFEIEGASYLSATAISNGIILTTDVGMARLLWG